jgi:hypothetical protein
MKNIHVLQTDKPSRLHTYKGILNLAAGEFVAPTIVKNDLINQNICITNSEEIKEGDWCVDTYKLKNNHNPIFKWSDKFKVDAKKIILTTDTNLIKDGVQAINDEFLEWFVKNPSCEWVEVDTYAKKIGVETDANGYREMDVFAKNYIIIIPQEKPKQENCCTPIGQIKRYVDCVGCDKKPKQMSKETAVDYLFNELIANPGNFIKAYKQAKETEKEMTINAFEEGNKFNGWALKHEPEQYYNETYKKEDK